MTCLSKKKLEETQTPLRKKSLTVWKNGNVFFNLKNKKGFDVLRASIVSIVKGGEKRMNTLDGTGQKNNLHRLMKPM